MKKIHLDFETRSEVNLKKVGSWVYSTHPTTEILCAAYAINKDGVRIVMRNQVYDKSFYPVIDKGTIVIAHNAMFEYMIYHNILVKKYGFPEIPKEQWRCTAAKASALALPRGLDALAIALELPVQKDAGGKAIMMKMCKPRKPLKKEKEHYKELGQPIPVLWHETKNDFKQLYNYCATDVDTERCADENMRDLSPSEQRVFHLDQKINLRGIKIDTQAIDSALKMIDDYTKELQQEVVKLTGGFLNKLSQRQAALTWIKGEGVKLPDFTKETVNEALNKPLPPKVKKVLELRQELGKTSLAKFESIKEGLDVLGVICDALIYHGAATGRWTGQRMQFHNLPRIVIEGIETVIKVLKTGNLVAFRKLYPNVLQTLSQCLRGMLIAREGKKFVGADWNAIEARILLWYAGDKAGLERYRTGKDSYKIMASKIFSTTLDKVTKMQRFVGKQTELGCGFGMGLNGERFVATCRKHNVTVPIELAKLAVRTYRNNHPAVTTYWRVVEQAAKDAVRTGKVVRLGLLNFFTHNDFLFIQLPSKRMLAYHKPLLEGHVLSHMGWVSQRGRYERQRTWGGTLVENIVQGTARDVVVFGMFRGEKWGYETLLSVHDEILTETKKGSAKEYEGILHVKPEWISDCPLKVEAWEGDRFLKV